MGTVVAMLVLTFSIGYLLMRSDPTPRRALNQDPTIRLIGPPQPGNCAVERTTDQALGQIVGVLGRDGRPLMYRIQEAPTPRRGGSSAAFPFDMPISEVRVVPCAG